MPEYEAANQQAADNASSISSRLSGSLWSLASSIISIASSILPNQRYDPLQQQPDDNSSIGSGEQDNQVSSAARDVTLIEAQAPQTSQTDGTRSITPIERGINNNQPSENFSNIGTRTRRTLWWFEDLRVLLFPTTHSRRVKLVN